MVGQPKIVEGIGVDIQAEVLVVVATEALSDAARVVQHGGYSVETVSIEVVLVVPPTQVGQQESEHLVLHIVEQATVPKGVLATGSVMKEAAVGAIELVQTVLDVLGGVRVDHIEQHIQAVRVGYVDHPFQLLWISVATGGSIEAGHLVAEASVVGVLHYGHDLDAVVALAFDSWHNAVGEFVVAANPWLLGRYSDVALVDPQRLGSGRARVLALIPLRCRWLPDVLLVVDSLVGRLWRLDHVLGPGRQTIQQLAGMIADDHFDLAEVLDGRTTVCVRRQHQFPFAVVQFLVRM